MPILSNSKHELFAQAIASGKGPSDAFEAAGFKRHSGNAARLSANESIRQRVEEIVGASAERAGVTVERIVADLASIAFMEDAKHSDRIAAHALLGKHLRMFTDKIEHSGGVTVEVVNF